MNKLPLILILILALAAPTLAAEPTVVPKTQHTKEIQPRAINPKASQLKELSKVVPLPYIDVALVRTTDDGEWTYVVPVRNSALVPAKAGTLEVVVFRKSGEQWTLVDTKTIEEEVPAAPKAGLAGNAVVATGIFPRCCTTYELMAKLRVKGTQKILDTKEFHAGSLKVMELTDLVIDNDNKGFTVSVKNRTSHLTLPGILKVSVANKPPFMQKVVVPPGVGSFKGSCQGLKRSEVLLIKLYAPTTCIEPEEACYLSQISKRANNQ